VKKVFLPLLAFALLVACNSGSDNASTEAGEDTAAGAPAGSPSAANDITTHPDYQKGLEVVAKSDCATCHGINNRIVGPAYAEVAKQYVNAADTTIERLANKVIQGGAGVWGQVPMTAHPTLSKEDATAAVKYVLLLKDEQ
jgi:cytochrome c